LAIWLGRNSHSLEAFTLSSSSSTRYYSADVHSILEPLAKAATAAAAAGRPLPLHTLRVLGDGPNLALAGQLVAALRNLRTLQLGTKGLVPADPGGNVGLVSRHLAPLQRATQLEELYLGGLSVVLPGTPYTLWFYEAAALCLPTSLKRLSLMGLHFEPPPPLQHLTQLTFLQLQAWQCHDLSSKLPPGLQELEVLSTDTDIAALGQQRQLVCGLACVSAEGVIGAEGGVMGRLPGFTNIRTLQLNVHDMSLSPTSTAAVARLPNLCTLRLCASLWRANPGQSVAHIMQGVSTIAAGSSSLRHLHLMPGAALMAAAAGLSQWTGLTRLSVCELGTRMGLQQYISPQYRWTPSLGQLPALRWLSVPHAALQAGWGWLGSLPRLRVLVVHCRAGPGSFGGAGWLEGCSPAVLPPCLQVLGICGMIMTPAEACQVRRLQQCLASSGCEVVVGPDLDEVADPMKQLAGLPVALQQALA
jgi:hypothetical protein